MDINIGKVISAKRKELGITQEALAGYCGVTKASVSKWESGQSFPDISILPILASYFRISIDELIEYAPQLDKESIHKLYLRLSGEFAAGDFNTVYSEVKETVRRYFSCNPLILQMVVLLVNHSTLAATPEQKNEILGYAESLCEKLIQESTDAWIVNQAKSLEATIYMMNGEFNKIIDSLEADIRPMVMNEATLANAYMSTGNSDKAEECLQISLYNYLMGMIGDFQLLLMNNLMDKEKKADIINRILTLEQAFHIDSLHPNSMAQTYLGIAYAYVIDGDNAKAIEILERYCNLCTKDFASFKLHGDAFFSKVDGWIEDFDLGVDAPRSESVVRADMYKIVAESPLYAPLHEEPGYIRIVQKLKEQIIN